MSLLKDCKRIRTIIEYAVRRYETKNWNNLRGTPPLSMFPYFSREFVLRHIRNFRPYIERTRLTVWEIINLKNVVNETDLTIRFSDIASLDLTDTKVRAIIESCPNIDHDAYEALISTDPTFNFHPAVDIIENPEEQHKGIYDHNIRLRSLPYPNMTNIDWSINGHINYMKMYTETSYMNSFDLERVMLNAGMPQHIFAKYHFRNRNKDREWMLKSEYFNSEFLYSGYTLVRDCDGWDFDQCIRIPCTKIFFAVQSWEGRQEEGNSVIVMCRRSINSTMSPSDVLRKNKNPDSERHLVEGCEFVYKRLIAKFSANIAEKWYDKQYLPGSVVCHQNTE